MKIYAIRDHEAEQLGDLAYLFYYEKVKEFYIEIREGVDPWDLPFVLDRAAERGRYTMGMEDSLRFISQRIVPKDRQNIGMILKDNGLEEYDEMKLLILADGRCAQDECYIRRITYDQLPKDIQKRMETYIGAIYSDEGEQLLIGFEDGTVGTVTWDHLAQRTRSLRRFLAYTGKLNGVELRKTGIEVVLPDGSGIPYSELRQSCTILPIRLEQLIGLAQNMLVSTQEVTVSFDCSRQNVNDLVRRGRLTPLKTNTREYFFERRELQKQQRQM